MKTKEKKRTVTVEEIWEDDFFNSYLREMDELVNRYPEDPNAIDLTEQTLSRLIKDLDKSWKDFQKKWQNKLQDPKQVFACATVEQKDGMRHLVIRSEFNDRELLDLQVSDAEEETEETA